MLCSAWLLLITMEVQRWHTEQRGCMAALAKNKLWGHVKKRQAMETQWIWSARQVLKCRPQLAHCTLRVPEFRY